MSSLFRLKESEVHPLIKLIGVAFYAINNDNNPKSIRFTDQELQRMFELHDNLGQYLDYLESQAYNQILTEEQNGNSTMHHVQPPGT